MSGSRRFLLLLLLASVTCVVLVQVTLDGWNLGGAFQYTEHASIKEHTIPVQHTESSVNTTVVVISTKQFVPVTDAASKTETASKIRSPTSKIPVKVSKKPRTFSKVHKALKNTTLSIPSRVQVRRIPLSRNISKVKSKELFVNRQERIQELMKKSVIHGRSSIDPLKALKPIPLADPNNVTRIFIITYFRAGSSFFGDLLQQNWKTFYHFEPLHSMTYDSRIGDDKIPEVFDLFNGIFKCNFSERKDYMQWVKRPRNQFLFAHNLFLWVTCHSNPKTCFNPSFVNAVCLRAPIHVMKVTRLHMRHLRSYLQDNPDLKIKVVYLTRDPRGILSSRWTLDWCNGTDCSDPNVLCHEMDEDIKIFENLQRGQPANFINVRYEDMSLNPEKEAQKLFKFLGLPFSPTVQKFLKTHTVGRRTDDINPYSTRRNSTAMAFSWRERVTYNQVLNVQSSCQNVLNKLNHSLITDAQQLPYPNGKKKVNISPEAEQMKRDNFNQNPLALRVKKLSSNKGEFFPISSDQLSVLLQSNHSEVKNLNNTNIEIHKTYKVLDGFSTKNNSETTNNLTESTVKS